MSARNWAASPRTPQAPRLTARYQELLRRVRITTVHAS